MTAPNGNVATATVKALGQSPVLLALVVLVGALIYFFGQRISARLDHFETSINARFDHLTLRLDHIEAEINCVEERSSAPNESGDLAGIPDRAIP